MRIASALVRLAVGAGLLLSVQAAEAQQKLQVHVILPLTGAAAFLGQGQQKTLQLLQDLTNKEGGIKGRQLEFAFTDDQSNPQMTLQAANSFLSQKPNVMLGSSIVAMCNAIAPLMKNGPVDYCLSPGVYPPPGSYVFSTSISTKAMMETAIRFYRLHGWTKIAVITSTDASGQDTDRNLASTLAMPENKDMQVVRHEHFNITDVSVAAQVERIKESNPQALIAWATGAPIATVFKGLVQDGVDLPTVTTNGNQVNAQMKQFASFIPKQLYIPSSLFIHHEGVFTMPPAVEAEQQKFYKALDGAGLPVDNMAALAWDPGRILIELLRKVGPDASAQQVHEALENTTDFAGINGIYNFKKYPQRGLGVEEVAMSTWDAKDSRWVPASEPGGKPLAH